jgi:hypothetical protein
LNKFIVFNKAIGAGFFAFILATSCCWLPALIVVLGGASSLLAFSDALNSASGPLMILGAACLMIGIYQIYKRKNMDTAINLQSTITCPACGHRKEETMPTDACQFFYQCDNCQTVLKPKSGDCCVYCSYGTVPCPPIQAGEKGDCCAN